ncbi:hypothetical protein EJ05DRAFT_435128, partial [Pseudovirgaria hyperparasitica]
TGRCLVFTPMVTQAISLVGELGYDAYYRESIAKEQVLNGFIAEEEGIIVTINALGLGVDLATIRVVIYLGAPSLFLDYI